MELIRQETDEQNLLNQDATPQEVTFKPLYLDELTGLERMVLKGLAQKIKEFRDGGLPIKQIRLKTEYWKAYRGIMQKCADRVEASVGNRFLGVKIKKGTLLQKDIIEVSGNWATTEDGRNRQREQLKMSTEHSN